MVNLVLAQDGDSSLTPSWKGYVQKPAVSSPRIYGDDLSLDLCCFLSLIINSFYMAHASIDRKDVNASIGI